MPEPWCCSTPDARRQTQQPRKRPVQVDIEAIIIRARHQHDLLDQPPQRLAGFFQPVFAPQALD